MQSLRDLLFQGPLADLDKPTRTQFGLRLQQFWQDIDRPLRQLYGHRPDYLEQRAHVVTIAAEAFAARCPELHNRDLAHLLAPDWHQRPDALGYVCYTERYAGTLRGVADKIPYLQELGVNYLHLMPLLKPRPGPNDGGYAVANYREVNPELGTMADLAALAKELHASGLRLCIDLVCNHTAREHPWAQKALAGDAHFQAYYHMFPDRREPDIYEASLLEVFPDFAPGNFTYYEQIDRWVWTTFNEFQWDLNYANPTVFAEMLATILFLANQGVDVLRLDAVAFMWKRPGTICQNEPEAHLILQALRAVTKLAAPGLLLLAEAIVPPPKLVPYLGWGEAANKECELAYHNVLMVMLWSALAERNIRLFSQAIKGMPPISTNSAWLTYVRCHDDIGWAVTEEDAGAVGLSGFAHRSFLSDFYSGIFPGTFARGTIFQSNPRTGDRRINGSAASLAGLEGALALGDEAALTQAIDRLLLLHGIIFTFGGLPVLYMGDELGLLNDYQYGRDPERANDSRWLHRPLMDWPLAERRHVPDSVTGRIYHGLRRLIQLRQSLPALHARASTRIIPTGSDQVLGLLRRSAWGELLVLANFSERPQWLPGEVLRAADLSTLLKDEISGQRLSLSGQIGLDPWQQMWLTPDPY